MEEPRRASISVSYKGTNITKEISKYISCFTYTDVSSGSSDSVEIELIDRDKKWMGKWHPEKDDEMNISICLHNWNKGNSKINFNCGNFTIDDLSYSGRPLRCSIGATSMPQHEAFNSRKRTKTWKKVTLYEIAKEIAQKSNLKLYYDADTIHIDKIEQNKQEDSKFLFSLCEDYCLGMKVFSGKLVLFDEEKYEKKSAVTTIHEEKVVDWSYNTTIAGTYTGARVSYMDSKNDKTQVVKIGSGNRILELNVRASSATEARTKGIAKLHSENKKSTTMTITMPANTKIVAGICVALEGFRRLDGKYYVEKVKHKIDSKSKYVITVNLRLV